MPLLLTVISHHWPQYIDYVAQRSYLPLMNGSRTSANSCRKRMEIIETNSTPRRLLYQFSHINAMFCWDQLSRNMYIQIRLQQLIRMDVCRVFLPWFCTRTIQATLTRWGRGKSRHFADDIFKCIFLNENIWIPIKISLGLVPQGPINNSPAMVQIMAWQRPGDKPLSEPMMVSLPTHIGVARPQWVKHLYFSVLLVVHVVTVNGTLFRHHLTSNVCLWKHWLHLMQFPYASSLRSIYACHAVKQPHQADISVGISDFSTIAISEKGNADRVLIYHDVYIWKNGVTMHSFFQCSGDSSKATYKLYTPYQR